MQGDGHKRKLSGEEFQPSKAQKLEGTTETGDQEPWQPFDNWIDSSELVSDFAQDFINQGRYEEVKNYIRANVGEFLQCPEYEEPPVPLMELAIKILDGNEEYQEDVEYVDEEQLDCLFSMFDRMGLKGPALSGFVDAVSLRPIGYSTLAFLANASRDIHASQAKQVAKTVATKLAVLATNRFNPVTKFAPLTSNVVSYFENLWEQTVEGVNRFPGKTRDIIKQLLSIVNSYVNCSGQLVALNVIDIYQPNEPAIPLLLSMVDARRDFTQTQGGYYTSNPMTIVIRYPIAGDLSWMEGSRDIQTGGVIYSSGSYFGPMLLGTVLKVDRMWIAFDPSGGSEIANSGHRGITIIFRTDDGHVIALDKHDEVYGVRGPLRMTLLKEGAMISNNAKMVEACGKDNPYRSGSAMHLLLSNYGIVVNPKTPVTMTNDLRLQPPNDLVQ